MTISTLLALAAVIALPQSGRPGAAPPAEPPVDVAAEAANLREIRQLTFPDRFTKAGEAYFSPDMTKLVFQAIEKPAEGETAEDFYAMFVADLVVDGDGRIAHLANIRRVSPEGSANTCGWFHPIDPNRILFGSTLVPPTESAPPGYQRGSGRYRWMFPPGMRIVEADLRTADGTAKTLKTLAGDGTAYVAEGSWSADGKELLYCSLESGQGDLFVKDLATGEATAIVAVPGYDGGPFFSPDGERICYRSDRHGNNLLQIFVAELKRDASGRIVGVATEHQVTDNDDVNWAPYWHPAGKHLVYASSAAGHRNYEIFLVDAADLSDANPPQKRYGTAERRVTFGEGADVLPVFSPDGRFLLWTGQRGEDRSSQIYIADFVMDLEAPSARMPDMRSDRVGSRESGASRDR
jgi:TolB protein